ncbi:phage tail protein [Solirubrobacter soli]|uniref:phage tail protein n=1 Tax=Solirubrobacter soli TaxID=363832 RepID=UPI000408045E|nr:hypothetical protein [Solirubrobacter soli]
MQSGREREVDEAPIVTDQAPAVAVEPPSLSGPLTAARIAALQRGAGNAAVARLLNDRGRPRPPISRFLDPSNLAGSAAELVGEAASGAAGAGASMAESAGAAAGGAAGAGATAAESAGGAAGAGAAAASGVPGAAGAAASGAAGAGASVAESAGAAAGGAAGAGATAAESAGAAASGAAGAGATMAESAGAAASGAAGAGATMAESAGAAASGAAGAGATMAESAGAAAGGAAGASATAAESAGAASASGAAGAGAAAEKLFGGGAAGAAAAEMLGSAGAGAAAGASAAELLTGGASAISEVLGGEHGAATAGEAKGGAGAAAAGEAKGAAGAAGAGPATAGEAKAAEGGAAGAAASGEVKGAAGGGAAGAAGAGPAAAGEAKAAEGGAAGAAASGEAKGAAGGGAAGAGPAAAGEAKAAESGAAGAAASGEVKGAAGGGAAGAAGAGPAAAGEAKAAESGAAGAAASGEVKGAAGGGAAGAAASGEAKAGAAGAGPAGGGEGKGAAGGAKGAAVGVEAKSAGAAGAVEEAKGGGGGAAAAHAAAGGGAAGPAVNKDPHADPAFQAMKGKSSAAAGGSKTHTPAAAGAANAQGAAVPPANDMSSQAQAAQVDEMATKEPGAFDRAAFIAAVKEAVDSSAPKNLEEADDFKDGGASEVKGKVSGIVKTGKDDSQKDIKDATVAAPDASKAKAKQVEPMANDPVGQATSTVGAANAMPAPVPQQTTDLSAGPDAVDKQMADADVTDEQIEKSNEPTFKDALTARDEAKQHSDKAPGEYRKTEQGVLGKAKGDAQGLEAQGLGQMHGARGQALQQAIGHKQGAKTEDEAKRAKVATDIQGIYERTKTDVTKTLGDLDGKVDQAFTAGESGARKSFEDYVGQRMDAYKDDRYSGLLGKGRWLKDKLMGMPSEVNAFYAEGKTRYLAAMDGVIGKVADVVGAALTAARARIAQGKAEIAKYVAQLPQDLQKVGKEAESKLDSQFEQLTADVDSKQSEMVDTLARKYVESRDSLDARIDEMKAANRGLVDKAIDAVAGVVKTIIQLKNMLLGVLAKAADVIGDIISDPIGFLGRLVDGIKAGLSRFVGNIASHLQEGLMGWLFGAIGRAGIQLPKNFDIAGIFDLVMQVLGLTYRQIRARVVKLVGERVMTKLEQTVDVFKILVTEGPAGLWHWIQDKVGDLEETVIGGIKNFIIEKVIKAGITWLIAFLNPAAAFIKACKAIYDIIMFIIERGSEIMDFVRSILDSIGAIAKGNIGIVAQKVEDSLARALPLAISFLASLLGLGGISEKIHSIIQKVQAPITKAVDFVVMGAVKGAKKLFGWAKGKYDAGKKWVKDKATAVKDRFTGKDKKGDEETADSKDVRAKVTRDLRGSLGSTYDDADTTKAKIEAVYNANAASGLKQISVERVGEADEIGVYVTASPRTLVMKLLHKDFKVGVRLGEARQMAAAQAEPEKVSIEDQERLAALNARRLGPRRGVQHTAATATWNGVSLPRQESSGLHAEQKLDMLIRRGVAAGTLKSNEQGKNQLAIQLTKSPCPNCSQILQTLAADLNVDVHLELLGLYRGSQEDTDPETGKKTPKSVEQKRQQKELSVDVLRELRAKGFKLSVLSVEKMLAEHYEGVELDDQELKVIRRRAKELEPIINKINSDAEKLDGTKVGS